MIEEIFPAFDTEAVPIVFESSGVFIPFLSVAIQTIIDSSSAKNNYDIIILTDNVSNIDIDRIQAQIYNLSNFSIRFFCPYDMVTKYIENANYHYITVNYYRMALPWILKNYDIAINLGADILVRKDIHALCEIVLENNVYIAGSRDLGYIGRLSEDIPQSELKLKKPEEYVNADVLILNLKKIRADFTLDNVMSSWQQFHFRCAEQDALNKLFDGHKQIIDMRWNTFPERMTSTKDIMCTKSEFIMQWRECLKDPFIVHFAAVPKPWDYPVIGYADAWWDTAEETVYFEEIIRRMSITKEVNINLALKLRDWLFPVGSRRREFAKKFKPQKKWGLNS